MNLPNKLSILRIILVPVFVVLFYLEWTYARYLSAVVFILAAATDFLDGYIARKYNLVTDLGKLLDPIADKLLVTSALFLVTSANVLPMPYPIMFAVCATLIVGRELLISVVRQIAAAKGQVIAANVFGKIKTVLQDVTLPLIILLQTPVTKTLLQDAVVYETILYVSIGLFVAATVVTVISGVVYLAQNKHVFAGGSKC